MRRLSGTIVLFYRLALCGYAQSPEPDTVLLLDDVNIVSGRLNQLARGQIIQSLDSMTRLENPSGVLSELIPGFTSAYVRNYGQGALSTLSIRGTSANHSALLWNGVRVAPPNIGYVDLSLIQGNYFREVNVFYGGASPLFGSGAIGGGIHLNNRPVFDTSGWNGQIMLAGGSFASLLSNGEVNCSTGKIYNHTVFSVNASQNDYPYEDLSGEKEKLDHASYFKGGFIQDLAVKIRADQYLMASAWFQYGSRDIPPAVTESESVAELMDRSWRTMLVWKDFNRKNVMEARIAYFNEYERYVDPKTDIYSVIRSQVATGAFESALELFSRSSMFGGASYTFEYADLDFYSGPEHQQSLALYASWMQEFPGLQWKLSLNARQEFMTGFRPPFLFSIGATGKIWKSFSGRLSFSRNFRAPTLNERYWEPGGNPDLQPEKSYNMEAGISLHPEADRLEPELSITGFSSWVENWILWLPGAGFWSVENAQEIWARGLEIALNATYRAERVILTMAGSYSFTLSTNENKISEYDDSYRKQLIYVPLHRLMVKGGVGWKGWRLTLRGNYTGRVYTTKDNESSLQPYLLLDAILGKVVKLNGNIPVSLQINLNNLTSRNYETVPYRPMPGFNVMGTIGLGIGGRRSAVGSRQSVAGGKGSAASGLEM